MKTKILTAIAIATLLTSCEKSESIATENGLAVSFSTSITTRAVGTTWESDDEMGAYMYLTDNTDIYAGSDNAKYTIANSSITSTLTLGTSSADIPMYFDNDQAEVILFPQTLSSSALCFNVNGYPYYVTLSKELEAGKQYTYTLEVGFNEVKLGSAVITDWTENASVALDPTIDRDDE